MLVFAQGITNKITDNIENLTLSRLRYLRIMCLKSNASNGSRGPRSLALSLAELLASIFYGKDQRHVNNKLCHTELMNCDIMSNDITIMHTVLKPPIETSNQVHISVTSTDIMISIIMKSITNNYVSNYLPIDGTIALKL